MQVKRQTFDRARFLTEFTRRFPCQHPNAAPCKRIKARTGVPFYRLQCPDCGAALSGQLKFSVVEAHLAAGHALGTWDEEKYSEIIRLRFAAAAEIKREFGWDAAGFWHRYEKYLLSDEWKALRLRILNRDHHTCQQPRCGQPAVQVHHLNYDNVGDELESDLTSVCMPCHQRLHPDRFSGHSV